MKEKQWRVTDYNAVNVSQSALIGFKWAFLCTSPPPSRDELQQKTSKSVQQFMWNVIFGEKVNTTEVMNQDLCNLMFYSCYNVFLHIFQMFSYYHNGEYDYTIRFLSQWRHN